MSLHAPCLPGLFSERLHAVADTSLEAFGAICPTLTARERAVFLALSDYCRTHADATGGELAADMGLPVTSIRPRLTMLHDKGWITRRPARESRCRGELRCHPYSATVPREAVERIR